MSKEKKAQEQEELDNEYAAAALDKDPGNYDQDPQYIKEAKERFQVDQQGQKNQDQATVTGDPTEG